jgi:hypothetical protein
MVLHTRSERSLLYSTKRKVYAFPMAILSIQISRASAGSVSHESTLGEERSRAILKAFFKIVRCE